MELKAWAQMSSVWHYPASHPPHNGFRFPLELAPAERRHVRFASRSGHVQCEKPCLLKSGHPAVSFDHFVGSGKERLRNGETERLGGLKVEIGRASCRERVESWVGG